MKKNYFLTLLLTLCFSTFSFGQVILAEGFSYADGSLVGNGAWAREGGTAGDFQVSSGKAVAQHGTPSEDVKIAFTSITGDVYVAFDFSVDDLGSPYSGTDNEYFTHLDFKARMDIVPPTASGDYTVGISSSTSTAQATWATDLTYGTTYRAVIKFDQVTGTAQLWINPSTSSDTSISGGDDGAATVTEFELRQSDSSVNETVRVDDLMIGQTFADVLTFAAQTDPTMSIGGITNNQVFAPNVTEITATFSIQNFELSGDNGSGMGDGTKDGYIKATLKETGEADVISSFFTTTPPAIQVVAGKSYTIIAELVDNGGNSLSSKVESTVDFSVASYTDVANLAALRAGTEGMYYKVTGQVILTYNTGNSRNQRYVQDGTAAILIDDSAGIITTNYAVGDAGTDIVGRLSSFGGVLQFVPTEDYGAPDSSGNSVTVQTVTIADLNANLDTYESEWIKIDDVAFSDADGTAVFEASKNYDITNGGNTLVFRTNFSSADFIGNVIPSGTANVTGIAGEFNGTGQIYGTSAANIVLDVKESSIDGFAAYPNPVRNGRLMITSATSDIKNVSIYNVLGRKIFTETISGTSKQLNISSIKSGIYILKVVEGTKSSTKKLVVR